MKVINRESLDKLVKKGKRIEKEGGDGFDAILNYGYRFLSNAEKNRFSEDEFQEHIENTEKEIIKRLEDE